MKKYALVIDGFAKLAERIKGVTPAHAALSQSDHGRSPVGKRHDAWACHKERNQLPAPRQFVDQTGEHQMPAQSRGEKSRGRRKRQHERCNAWEDHCRQKNERDKQNLFN